MALTDIKHNWWLFVPFALWLFFKDTLGTVTIYVSTEYMAIFYLMVFSGSAFIEQAKYSSPQFIGNDFHMCVKKPHYAGKWVIFTDYIDSGAYGVTWALNSTTIVVPRQSVFQIGRNFFSTARLKKVDYHDLALFPQQVIYSHGYSQKNIFLGVFSQSDEKALEVFVQSLSPDDAEKAKDAIKKRLEFLEDELILSNNAASKNRDMARLNLKDLEGLKGSVDRLSSTRQSWFSNMLDKYNDEGEDKK